MRLHTKEKNYTSTHTERKEVLAETPFCEGTSTPRDKSLESTKFKTKPNTSHPSTVNPSQSDSATVQENKLKSEERTITSEKFYYEALNSLKAGKFIENPYEVVEALILEDRNELLKAACHYGDSDLIGCLLLTDDIEILRKPSPKDSKQYSCFAYAYYSWSGTYGKKNNY